MLRNLSCGKKAFAWAFLLALLIFLPFIIYNSGIFVYMGDYNAQQIPFYKLAHEAVRSGNILWNWNTDLGVNFIGSYSFYLLFSPFFWLTLPFPTEAVPYLMGPLLILKTALAAYTSYLYIKRFVKDKNFAVLGSCMYAFSGFMIFNIFFNHFHDVVVFFPLLLLSLDKLVEEGKRGFFAFMVAVSACVNYWFFIGEVVFTIIYVFIRIFTDENWRSFKKFLLIAFESILGVGIACCVLLPSALAVTGNPRTGMNSMINGDLLWVYGFRQRLPAILSSFFFPPEMPSRPCFFPDMGAKWASLSAWLPLFSQVGTIAYLKSRKKDTIKSVIVVSFVMSLVPVLNSAFVLFNNSYYARWFYMPILFLIIATCIILEERLQLEKEIKASFLIVAGITALFILAVGLSPNRDNEGVLHFGFYSGTKMFLFMSFTAVLCLILCGLLLFKLRESDKFLKFTSISLSAVIVFFTFGYMADGKNSRETDAPYIDLVLNGKEEFQLPEDEFYRTDFYDCPNNMGMLTGKSTINAFHSIVPPSVMEFYPYVSIKRDVSTKPPLSHEALRPLMSVKYIFVKSNEENQPPIEGYELYKAYERYNVYENPDFIPMGFMYDTAIPRSLVDELDGIQKLRYMLSSAFLEDEDADELDGFMKIEREVHYENVSPSFAKIAVNEKKLRACSYFQKDKNGFTAKIDADRDGLIFFSVPYDKGWTASVNGKGTDIIKANVGFMALKINEGVNEIRFDYVPVGLRPGIFISIASFAFTLLYLIFFKKRKLQKPETEANEI